MKEADDKLKAAEIDKEGLKRDIGRLNEKVKIAENETQYVSIDTVQFVGIRTNKIETRAASEGNHFP